ncbi:MAG: DUF1428 domain-containing protein [Deltaproteobacteria bacterium]|nr:MAG: DUF1428 domain-containing protein [Deltaproteobacteria bacterium]
MTYVDGFVLAVPKDKKQEYLAMSKKASTVFLQNGALQHVECWEDDVPDGKVTSFPMAVKKSEDEAVVFSWITWPDKQTRDEGMKKTMEDPSLQCDMNEPPFDGQRMIFGGFQMAMEASQ